MALTLQLEILVDKRKGLLVFEDYANFLEYILRPFGEIKSITQKVIKTKGYVLAQLQLNHTAWEILIGY